MQFIAFTILILCALGLCFVKCVGEMSQQGRFYEGLELAAKKALRYTLHGGVAVGLAMLVLSQFSIVRKIGFAFIPEEFIEYIRDLLRIVFNTSSVYVAIETLAGFMLLSVECCLILSFVGFFATKGFVFSQALTCSRIEREKTKERCQEVAIPYAERKLFLSFANLRI